MRVNGPLIRGQLTHSEGKQPTSECLQMDEMCKQTHHEANRPLAVEQ